MKQGLKALLVFIFLGGGAFLYAQKSQVFLNPDAEFRNGINLFEHQKYGAAQHSFQQIIQNTSTENFILKSDAEFHSALCALELFHADAEMLLKNFIANHPESPRVAKAYFHLGKYNYRKKKYDKAIDYFEKVEKYELNSEEAHEYYFKKGYSFFDMEQMEKAKKDFYEVKDTSSKYIGAATYYLSHILYNEESYEMALSGFLKLTENESFGPIVPYYIAQIYYLQGKYEKVISYAPSLLDSANTKRGPEIARIIGESYYKTGNYKFAIPFLRRYEKFMGKLNRQDYYELGYASHKSGDIRSAEEYFRWAIDGDDSLSQNAYYHLADCYIKLDKKTQARTCFRKASKMKFDFDIYEDALFQYAKLCLELSYNPFNEAIEALNKYIKEFPESLRIDEAHEYLVSIYLTTKNYKDGMASIEKISKINDKLKPVYQKLAYNRAVELFNDNEFDEALKNFDRVSTYPIDRSLNPLSKYWKAETYYRKAETEKDKSFYNNAIEQYKKFLFEPGAVLLSQYNNVHYNIGYAYFKQNEYSDAAIAFRKYTSIKNTNSPEKLCNAYIRLGDCYLMLKDLPNAADFYQDAAQVKNAKGEKDYALYQRAIVLGFMKKTEAKINTLIELLSVAPSSTYAPEVKYELGKTYFEMDQPEKALPYFTKVIHEHPKSAYVNKSLLATGQIYFNNKEEDKALGYFEMVVQNNRKSEEANEAISQVKNVFKSKKDLAGMQTWLKKYGAEIPRASLDSMEHKNCMDDYFEKNCLVSIQSFSKYIHQYPDGIFILDANFYKAECENKIGNTDLALGGYNFVIDHSTGKNVFLEPSLVNAARINFKAKYYENALKNFDRLSDLAEDPKNFLDARMGQMRCNFYLKNLPLALNYSKNVLANEKSTKENKDEAHFIMAKVELERNNLDTAYMEFNIVQKSSRTTMRAESKYNMAHIQYLKKEHKKAEKQIFDIVNTETANEYWMGKSFILLADNYLAQADTFQAKTTLQAFIENSDNAELKALAEIKLKAIQEAEKVTLPVKKEEEILVPVNDENEKLFEDKKEGETGNE